MQYGLEAGEVLLRLLEAYSPTGEEEKARDVLVGLADELGLKVRVDEVGNVIASKGDGGKVWLVGHYDTVPGKLPIRWSEGIISGRGAVDAKGPLSAMLMAASLSEYPVAVAALVGEEGDSRGAKHLLRGTLPPYVVIGEPSNTVGIVIAYRGGTQVTLRCESEGGHSSSPSTSSVDLLISSILAVREIAPGRSYDEPSAAVTMLRAGEAPNVLPKEAEAIIDLRIPPGVDTGHLLESIKRRLPEGCYLSVGWTVLPISVKPSDQVPRALARAILSLGRKPKLLKKYGSSDMNTLHERVRSIAAYGPGDGRLSHTDREAITVSDLELAVKVYLRAVEYLSSQEAVRFK